VIPDTAQTLIIAILTVVPGGVYTWAFEQQAGRYGANFGDRVQRFLAVSVLLVTLQLPVLYLAVRHLLREGFKPFEDNLPWWLWLVALAYVAVPFLLGRLVGLGTAQRARWATWITGPAPAPRAWDELFSRPDLNGWIRVQLSDGRWVCGLWGTSTTTGLTSYASGYPEEKDLLIAEIAETDENGEFITEEGAPVLTGRAAMVAWETTLYSEFIPG
jgi:hypothetical protein